MLAELLRQTIEAGKAIAQASSPRLQRTLEGARNLLRSFRLLPPQRPGHQQRTIPRGPRPFVPQVVRSVTRVPQVIRERVPQIVHQRVPQVVRSVTRVPQVIRERVPQIVRSVTRVPQIVRQPVPQIVRSLDQMQQIRYVPLGMSGTRPGPRAVRRRQLQIPRLRQSPTEIPRTSVLDRLHRSKPDRTGSAQKEHSWARVWPLWPGRRQRQAAEPLPTRRQVERILAILRQQRAQRLARTRTAAEGKPESMPRIGQIVRTGRAARSLGQMRLGPILGGRLSGQIAGATRAAGALRMLAGAAMGAVGGILLIATVYAAVRTACIRMFRAVVESGRELVRFSSVVQQAYNQLEHARYVAQMRVAQATASSTARVVAQARQLEAARVPIRVLRAEMRNWIAELGGKFELVGARFTNRIIEVLAKLPGWMGDVFERALKAKTQPLQLHPLEAFLNDVASGRFQGRANWPPPQTRRHSAGP